ncbi:MAG: cupin domain-containing protein [Acidimicrobiales bacterium]
MCSGREGDDRSVGLTRAERYVAVTGLLLANALAGLALRLDRRPAHTPAPLADVKNVSHKAGVVENPVSGERIRILRRGGGPDGDALVWELVLAPGGQVPSSHRHPRQEECFNVLEGELELRVGRQRLQVRRGESATVPPGLVHHFANRGATATRVVVETVPALDMEPLLRTAAALARDQHQAGKRVPRLVDLALFMWEFRAEVSAPWVPTVADVATRAIARLACVFGYDLRYRQLRGSAAGSGSYPG